MVKLCKTWTIALGPPKQTQTLETDCGDEVTPECERVHNTACAAAMEVYPPVPGEPIINVQKPPAST